MEDETNSKPLRMYTLGQFSLVSNGVTIRLSAKAKKPIALLKALLAAGGHEISAARLTDDLWPEAEGDTAYNTLNVTLHRLRKLLGERDAIQLLDNKLSLNSQTCWVDAWEFERQMNGIEAQLKLPQPCQIAIRAGTTKLLELGKGAFLNCEACPKIIATRDRLHRKFLRLLNAIGEYWEKQGDWAHARELYLQGLELEPMLESLYQRLMICHREMGQRTEAMMIYRHCQEALSSHLNFSPSCHTEAIRQTLTTI